MEPDIQLPEDTIYGTPPSSTPDIVMPPLVVTPGGGGPTTAEEIVAPYLEWTKDMPQATDSGWGGPIPEGPPGLWTDQY